MHIVASGPRRRARPTGPPSDDLRERDLRVTPSADVTCEAADSAGGWTGRLPHAARSDLSRRLRRADRVPWRRAMAGAPMHRATTHATNGAQSALSGASRMPLYAAGLIPALRADYRSVISRAARLPRQPFPICRPHECCCWHGSPACVVERRRRRSGVLDYLIGVRALRLRARTPTSRARAFNR